MEISRETPTTIKLQFRGTTLSIGAEPSHAPVRLAVRDLEELVAKDDERIFQGPGEYETAGIMIDGVDTGQTYISYHILHDGQQISCLAFDAADSVTDEMIEQLQPSQVVCVWSSEKSSTQLAALLTRFEAQLIIPVSTSESVESLAQELQLKPESIDRLKLSLKDLDTPQQRLIELT